MRSASRPPTPDKLSRDPELAALAALDLLLELAISSLFARHPEIGLDVPYDTATTLARLVIESARDLRRLVRRYRAALARDDLNIPF